MKKLTFVLIFTLLTVNNLFAQWTKMDGPYGITITSIASLDGAKIYCTTIATNLYSTIDTGLTWQKEFKSLFEFSGNSIVAAEGKIIVVRDYYTGSPYAFMSLDSGVSFNPFPAPFADTIQGYEPVFKIYPSGIYCLCIAGLYQTTDNGQNWTSLNIPDPALTGDFVVYGNNVLISRFDSIFYSINSGPWTGTTVDSTVAPVYPYRLKESLGVVYATTSNGIYRTYDNGLTWSDISANFGNNSMYNFELIDNNIYIMNGDEIWVTDTAIINWSNTDFMLPGYNKYAQCFYRSGSVFLAATSFGIYRGDTTFANPAVNSSYGIEIYNPEGFLIDSNVIHVGDNSCYHISNDGGITWTEPSEPVGAQDIKRYGNDIFICKSNELWQSAAGALTANYLNPVTAWDITKTASGNLFVASFGNGVYFSSDNGVTFNPVNNGLPDLNMFTILSIGDNVVAGNVYDGLYLTTDNGTTWTQTGASGYGVFDLVRHNNLLFAEAVGFDLLVSADSGLTWQQSPGTFSGGNYNFLLSNGSQLFVINQQPGGFGSVAMSVDSGLSWIDISSFLTPNQFTQVASVTVTADHLYFADAVRGIWSIPIPTLLGNAALTQTDETVSIYPNPASGHVMIYFNDKHHGGKSLFELSDITGRKLMSVTLQSTENKILLNTIQSGIYLYKLTTPKGIFNQGKLVIED